MPFTFSHPTYAFPLKLLKPAYFSLTGLILGSTGPDFEYFILLEPHKTIGHSLAGLWIQVIPMSICLAFIFHYLVKEALTLHLPSYKHLDQRAYQLLKPWSIGKWKDWIIFIISIMIGFCSHIALDSFTHEYGYFVIMYPILAENFLFLPVYKILQYSLSVFGLLVEIWWMIAVLFNFYIGYLFV